MSWSNPYWIWKRNRLFDWHCDSADRLSILYNDLAYCCLKSSDSNGYIGKTALSGDVHGNCIWVTYHWRIIIVTHYHGRRTTSWIPKIHSKSSVATAYSYTSRIWAFWTIWFSWTIYNANSAEHWYAK